MTRVTLCLAVALAACGGDDAGSGDGDLPSGDGGGATIDAGAAGDAAAAAGCEQYCAAVMDRCTASLAQYRELESCLTSCALFPPGAPGADSGDSLACRVTHAGLAAGQPDPHCRHAGPSGGGVCGAPCEAYCDLVMAVCDLHADRDGCMTTCAGFPDTAPYSTRESRSDTLACRIFHASLATAEDGHCGTASADSPTCTE